MRTWERTRLVESCGSCNARLQVGTPIQVIQLPTVIPRRIRCEACADGPVDVEQLERFDVVEEGRSATKAVLPSFPEFRGVTRNLFDGKAAAMPSGDE